jgi:hypothetical protein
MTEGSVATLALAALPNVCDTIVVVASESLRWSVSCFAALDERSRKQQEYARELQAQVSVWGRISDLVSRCNES